MRRLGAVLLVLLALGAVNTKALWSGGSEWGTASTARAAATWQPDGVTPSGEPFPDVAIAGRLLTTSNVMAVSWSLGISGFLSDLSPSTASVTMVGQITATMGDPVVISTGWGVAWSGRVDSINETRDVNGDYWTTVTATDNIGALGAAAVVNYALPALAFSYATQLEALSDVAGIHVDVVDGTSSGMPNVVWSPGTGYTGTLLDFMNRMTQAVNGMLAMTRDGSFKLVIRESVVPSSVLTLTGVNAPTSWTKQANADVDINRWYVGSFWGELGRDQADINVYGDRPYVSDTEQQLYASSAAIYADWIAYGGSQRPIVSDGQLVVSDFSQSALILLEPFQWVTESGTAWQVMSVSHSVTPGDWRVTITADNLLDLL